MADITIALGNVKGQQGNPGQDGADGHTPTPDEIRDALAQTVSTSTIYEATALTPAVGTRNVITSLTTESPALVSVTLPANASELDELSVHVRVGDETAEVWSPWPSVAMEVSASDYVAISHEGVTASPWAIEMRARRTGGAWQVVMRGFEAPEGWIDANSTRKIIFSAGHHPSKQSSETYDLVTEDGSLLTPSGFATLLDIAPLAGWSTAASSLAVEYTPGQSITKSSLPRTLTLYPLYTITEQLLTSQTSSLSPAAYAKEYHIDIPSLYGEPVKVRGTATLDNPSGTSIWAQFRIKPYGSSVFQFTTIASRSRNEAQVDSDSPIATVAENDTARDLYVTHTGTGNTATAYSVAAYLQVGDIEEEVTP